MDKQVVFGEQWIPARFPDDRTHVVPAGGIDLPLSPVEDLAGAVRAALARPLDRPPLREMARPGWRVTVAFDDPTVPCYAPVWETAIPVILEELGRAGVERRRVTLLCANAVHRKFTPAELARILGEPLAQEFADRLLCNDAEDPENLVHLGKTARGHDVELNRLVADSDLTIYVNTSCTRGFSGGWKSVCVGLSTWRSIRWTHTPDGMTMSVRDNRMHRVFDEMGQHLEARLGRRVFKVETLVANPATIARVWAGGVAETRAAALEVAASLNPPRRSAAEPADVVVYGLPAWSPYATFARMNPILTLISSGLGYLGGYIEALGKPGCSVIMATPCPEQWDMEHHPAYPEVWDRVLTQTLDPYEISERFTDEFATRADYIDLYRNGNAFHPLHAIMATHPLKRLRHAARVFVAGVDDPAVPQHLGFIPTPTVEEAIAQAERFHGRDCSIVCVKILGL